MSPTKNKDQPQGPRRRTRPREEPRKEQGMNTRTEKPGLENKEQEQGPRAKVRPREEPSKEQGLNARTKKIRL